MPFATGFTSLKMKITPGTQLKPSSGREYFLADTARNPVLREHLLTHSKKTRTIEHNVALIVACMPSFASLMRIPISEWTVVKTLRSKLSNASILRSSRRDDDSSSKESLEKSDRAYGPGGGERSGAGGGARATSRGPPHQ